MPYRIDLDNGGNAALDRLIELGALDVELADDCAIAALMPDGIAPEQIASALGVDEISISPASGHDAGSVWVLNRRPIRVGRLHIVPAHMEAERGSLRLIDGPAFGTGLHPTTALCLTALDEAVHINRPDTLLDVGTGSGVLALGALMMGVPKAIGVDVDDAALGVAAQNARLNGFEERLRLVRGGPESVTGTWPLVVGNVLAAPLIEMAPALVRRVGHNGRLLLSGIPCAVEHDVDHAYRRLGMRRVAVKSRAGWTALVLEASW